MLLLPWSSEPFLLLPQVNLLNHVRMGKDMAVNVPLFGFLLLH